jgi:hypothetical protein
MKNIRYTLRPCYATQGIVGEDSIMKDSSGQCEWTWDVKRRGTRFFAVAQNDRIKLVMGINK